MKRLFLLLVTSIFFLLSNTSNAQSYIPFPDSGATWVNTHYNLVGSPPFFYQQLQNVEYYCSQGSDTIIGSNIYTQIYYCDSIYDSAIRDDGNGKIYVVPRDSSFEYLLYDFTVHPGDTLENVYCKFGPAYCWNGFATYYVNNVDSILIGNDLRKRIYFDSGGNWIEGIGNVQGLFWEAGANVSMYALGLHCFSLNDTTFYSPGNYNPSPVSCSFDVGVENLEISKTSFNLFPNPVEEFVNLNFKEQKTRTIELFTISGVLVNKIIISDNDYALDVTEIPYGVYLLRISQGISVATKKLIKM